MFWIDDVWLTGLVAGQLGVDRYSLNSYYTVYRYILSDYGLLATTIENNPYNYLPNVIMK